jgi:hypothetical protein
MTMVVSVMFSRFVLVMLSMLVMSVSYMRVVCSFFMIAVLVMLGRFAVVSSSLFVMIRCFFVMIVFHDIMVLVLDNIKIHRLKANSQKCSVKFLR